MERLPQLARPVSPTAQPAGQVPSTAGQAAHGQPCRAAPPAAEQACSPAPAMLASGYSACPARHPGAARQQPANQAGAQAGQAGPMAGASHSQLEPAKMIFQPARLEFQVLVPWQPCSFSRDLEFREFVLRSDFSVGFWLSLGSSVL